MSFVEDVFKGGNIVTALAIGVGALILAPPPPGCRGHRQTPCQGGGTRRRCSVYKSGRDAVVETGKAVSDAVAEAKAELHRGTET